MNRDQITLVVVAGVIVALLLFFFPFFPHQPSGIDNELFLEDAFNTWSKAHFRSYASPSERTRRFSNFVASFRMVQEHNQKKSSYRLGLTEFADYSSSEFFQTRAPIPAKECYLEHTATYRSASSSLSLPSEVDYRKSNAVSVVKNQKSCGSCWSFATTGALESHLRIKNHRRRGVLLSEQELVDCSGDFGNQGCHGGWPASAMQYIVENHGLTLAQFYPYTATESNRCHTENFSPLEKTLLSGVRLTGVYNLTLGDELGLEMAVASVGPVTIAFKVLDDFRLYAGGVYRSEKCHNIGPNELSHAVLIVGFGRTETNGDKFWILKNSWGTQWGEEGFFRMERGSDMCGVAQCASFPILK